MRLAAIILAGLSLLDQNQVFRSQANAAAVDVVVTDKSGRVVKTLTADDFVVTSNKKPRRVLTAEFIETRAATRSALMPLPEPGLVPISATSNRAEERGRVFMIAVDTAMIRLGGGRAVMQDIGAFLDRLAPQDVVGLVSMPTGKPFVALTRDRAPVREALRTVSGIGADLSDCSPTYGEAAAIAAGDMLGATRAISERLGTDNRCDMDEAALRAGTGLLKVRTRRLLDDVGTLADALADDPGLKTIVLVSEGMYLDRDLDDEVERLVARAEAAHARIYALHLDTPPIDGKSRGSAIASHALNDRFGFDAMSRVSSATGGTALRVNGSALRTLGRVDDEAAGYYLLGVEIDESERGNTPIDISVKTRRSGLDVRSRWLFSARPPKGARFGVDPVRDTVLSAANLLTSAVLAADFEINVDTVVEPGATAMARIDVIADFGAGPDDIAAVGFHLAAADGRTVAGRVEPDPKLLAHGTGASYLVGADVAPGDYRLRLSAVSKTGARASIERALSIAAPPGVQLAMTFLRVDGSSAPSPIAALAPDDRRLGVRVEWPAASAGEPLALRVRIAKVGEKTWLAETEFPVMTAGAVMSASGAITTAQLPKGVYVLKAELWAGGRSTLSTAKQFIVR